MPPDKSFPDFKQEVQIDLHWSCCLKAGTDITGLVLILMISDQCTYTCLHHNTPLYAFISKILTMIVYDWIVASLLDSVDLSCIFHAIHND